MNIRPNGDHTEFLAQPPTCWATGWWSKPLPVFWGIWKWIELTAHISSSTKVNQAHRQCVNPHEIESNSLLAPRASGRYSPMMMQCHSARDSEMAREIQQWWDGVDDSQTSSTMARQVQWHRYRLNNIYSGGWYWFRVRLDNIESGRWYWFWFELDDIVSDWTTSIRVGWHQYSFDDIWFRWCSAAMCRITRWVSIKMGSTMSSIEIGLNAAGLVGYPDWFMTLRWGLCVSPRLAHVTVIESALEP